MIRLLAPLFALTILAACSPTENTAELVDVDPSAFEWQSQPVSETEDGIPQIQVRLINNVLGMEYFTANCTGTLMTADDSGTEDVTSAVCWWAGGGEQFAVVESGTDLLVRQRWVDEEGGFGPWETKTTIK